MKGQFTFLGTGGSMGVPLIGCDCEVCSSKDPHNKRLRPSGLVNISNKTILFDCGPDFRMQMLNNRIKTLDGLIFTHAHYDHTGGFDEIRIFNARSKQPLPCLLSQETLDELKGRFPYVFANAQFPVLTTKVTPILLKDSRGSTEFLGIPISYVSYEQGGMVVNGYRLGNLAYISDIKHFPETIYEDLAGVETLIVSCLRHDHSPLHFNVEEAVAFAKRVDAKMTWFTHIAHELEHEKTNALLPSNCQLAYDGLTIDFQIG